MYLTRLRNAIENEVVTKKRFGTPDEKQRVSLVKDEVS
jgi:hypothetical protein